MKVITRIFLLFTLCAFVETTSANAMPSISHALMDDGVTAAQSQVSKGHQCHHHDETKQSKKTTNNDKNNHCCDKGMCKCIGNACHGGLAGMFGSSDAAFFLSSSQTKISFTNEFADLALPNHLKRPPRA